MYVGKEEREEKIHSVVPYPSTSTQGMKPPEMLPRLEQELEKTQARLTRSFYTYQWYCLLYFSGVMY